MVINFENFLNEVLQEDDKKPKDVLEITPEEVNSNKLTKQEISPIQITPLLNQIQQLNTQASNSPDSLKEIHKTLEDFEKQLPQYILEIYNTFYITQNDLKKKYLTSFQNSTTRKIEEVTQFIQQKISEIETYISSNEFEKAHMYLQDLNIEISNIPNSYFSIKHNSLTQYNSILKKYYDTLSQNYDSSKNIIISVIKKFISNTNILYSKNRKLIDTEIHNILDFLSRKKIEFDVLHKDIIQQLNKHYTKLLEHRISLHSLYETELKKTLSILLKKFDSEFSKQHINNSLIYLEMSYILLKKETQYNQELKISQFIEILDKRSQLYSLIYSKKKISDQKELQHIHMTSLIKLIEFLNSSKSLLIYSNEEVNEIIESIKSNDLLIDSYKREYISRLEILLSQSIHNKSKHVQETIKQENTYNIRENSDIDNIEREIESKEDNQKSKNNKDNMKIQTNQVSEFKDEHNTKKLKQLQLNISQLFLEFKNEVTPSVKIKKKYELLRYIKEHVREDKQEDFIKKINRMSQSSMQVI